MEISESGHKFRLAVTLKKTWPCQAFLVEGGALVAALKNLIPVKK